jgi:poly(beta-D-mannuronate) lyase
MGAALSKPKCCCCKHRDDPESKDPATPEIPRPDTPIPPIVNNQIDLSQWKLTLPTGAPGSPSEIFPPTLLSYSGTNFIKSDKGIVMKCPTTGVTTKGSSYPRCEFRELNAAWDGAVGVHVMKFTGSVDHLPTKKPQVVFGQIHNAEDDVFFLRVTKTGAACILEAVHDTTKFGLLYKNYVLGSKIQISITVADNVLTIVSPEAFVKIPFINLPSLKGCYFKLGCYTQSNISKGDGEGEYGQVTVTSVEIAHK